MLVPGMGAEGEAPAQGSQQAGTTQVPVLHHFTGISDTKSHQSLVASPDLEGSGGGGHRLAAKPGSTNLYAWAPG